MYYPRTNNLTPVDEAEQQVEAVLGNLAAALLGRLPIVTTVESSIVALEKAGRFLRVARR